MAASRRHLTALAVILAGAVAAHVLQAKRQPAAEYSVNFDAVPSKIGTYQGESLPIDDSIYRFLEADAMLERTYVGEGSSIKLSLIYAADWRSLHSPAGCYPAGGWHTVTDEQVAIPASTDSPTRAPLQARLLRVRKNETELLAMFTFCHPGGTTSDWAKQGLKVMTGPRGAGGVVISLSTSHTGQLTEARQRLMSFLQQVYPHAVAFWYQDD